MSETERPRPMYIVNVDGNGKRYGNIVLSDGTKSIDSWSQEAARFDAERLHLADGAFVYNTLEEICLLMADIKNSGLPEEMTEEDTNISEGYEAALAAFLAKRKFLS